MREIIFEALAYFTIIVLIISVVFAPIIVFVTPEWSKIIILALIWAIFFTVVRWYDDRE